MAKTIEEKIKEVRSFLLNEKPKEPEKPEVIEVTESEKEKEKVSIKKIEGIIASLPGESVVAEAEEIITPEKKPEVIDYTAFLKDFPGGSEALTSFLFDYLAGRHGDHWKLTPDENKRYSIICEAMMVKYAPKLLKWNLEISFVIMTGMIIVPRVKEDIRLKKMLSQKNDNKQESLLKREIVKEIDVEEKMRRDLEKKNG